MALTKKEIQKLDASQKAKALREAGAWGEYEQVSLLLKLGADAQAQAPSAERSHPESSGSQSSAFKQIEKGDTALNAAARGGFLDAVKILVSSTGSPASQKEATMRVSGTHGAQTPAMAAASSSNPEALDVLVWLMELEPACAVKSATAQGPAWSAAQSGNGRGLARVAIFLEQERGIQAATQCFDEPDMLGRTLLHWALASGSSEACQVAIERSGPHAFEQIDVRGCNVWLCAAKSRSWEPFDLLLAHAKKMKNWNNNIFKVYDKSFRPNTNEDLWEITNFEKLNMLIWGRKKTDMLQGHQTKIHFEGKNSYNTGHHTTYIMNGPDSSSLYYAIKVDITA